jgi:hypothetical protein
VSDFIFDLVRDRVRAINGHPRIHLEMHVHQVFVPALAHEAFFHRGHFGRADSD